MERRFGRTGNPGISGLAAINRLLATMVLPLAYELGPVQVNAVSPSVIDKPWWNQHPEALKHRIFGQIIASILVQRIWRAEEVADAIVLSPATITSRA